MSLLLSLLCVSTVEWWPRSNQESMYHRVRICQLPLVVTVLWSFEQTTKLTTYNSYLTVPPLLHTSRGQIHEEVSLTLINKSPEIVLILSDVLRVVTIKFICEKPLLQSIEEIATVFIAFCKSRRLSRRVPQYRYSRKSLNSFLLFSLNLAARFCVSVSP